MLTALKQVDPDFEAISDSLKASRFRTLARVTVPLCMPAMLDVSIYFFLSAMTTVSAVVFLYSTNTSLASVAVINMDDAGEFAFAIAMACVISATCIAARGRALPAHARHPAARARLEGSHNVSGAPIVVVGAGIVGICCAAYLRREGHEVLIMEREGPGEGTSKGNAGALSPYSCVPLAMPGVFKKIPGWLMDPEGPLTIQPRYFVRALPWLLRFTLSARPERVNADRGRPRRPAPACLRLLRAVGRRVPDAASLSIAREHSTSIGASAHSATACPTGKCAATAAVRCNRSPAARCASWCRSFRPPTRTVCCCRITAMSPVPIGW